MSICNSVTDVMGQLTPLTIRLKCAIKQLFSPEYSLKWDDYIPVDQQPTWEELITMLVKSSRLEFDRCVVLGGVDQQSTLVTFWDGSDKAFACVISGMVVTRPLPV